MVDWLLRNGNYGHAMFFATWMIQSPCRGPHYAVLLLWRGWQRLDLAQDCLQEIENELDDHAGVSKLRTFVTLTRQGTGVTEASRSLGISPEHASRTFKTNLVELLAEKLILKLR